MNRSRYRLAFRFWLLLALAGALAVPCPAGSLQDVVGPIPVHQATFIAADDGRVWLFPLGSGKVNVLQGGKVAEFAGEAPLGSVGAVLRLPEQSQWIVLTTLSENEAALYRFDGQRFSRFALVQGAAQGATLARTADGVVWVVGRNGVFYGAKDDARPTYSLNPLPEEGRRTPFVNQGNAAALDLAGGETWFWVQASLWLPRGQMARLPLQFRGIGGFHAYRDGTWRILPFADPDGVPLYLTSAVVAGDGRVVGAVHGGGFVTIQPGAETVEPLVVPALADLDCVFLHAVPASDSLLAIAWPRRSPAVTRVPNNGGALWRIRGTEAERLVPNGHFLYGYTPRAGTTWPAVNVDKGTIVATVDQGLLFVPFTGTGVVRIGWRQGLAALGPTTMQVAGERLCLLDPQIGFTSVRWRDLATASPVAGAEPWDLFPLAFPPLQTPDGAIWFCESGATSSLRCWTGQAWAQVPSPPAPPPPASVRTQAAATTAAQRSTATYPSYPALDSRGRVWWMGTLGSSVLTEENTWRSLGSLEDVCRWLLATDPGISVRVGAPTDTHFIITAGDGRAAYRPDPRIIRFLEPPATVFQEEQQRNDAGPGTPAYVDGILTLFCPWSNQRQGLTARQWRDGKWSDGEGLPPPWPWPGESPFGGQRQFGGDIRPSPGFPAKELVCTLQATDNLGLTWLGTPDQLYHGQSDCWVRFLTAGMPASMFDGLAQVFVDPAGGYWFHIRGLYGPARLLHYRPAGDPPRLDWATPPPAQVAADTLELKARWAGEGTPLAYSLRFDDDPVRLVRNVDRAHTFPLRGLRNGPHTCELRTYDATLRPSRPLVHRFTVARDVTGDLPVWLKTLSSADSVAREQARARLLGVGLGVLPAVREQANAAAPDERWWYDALVRDLEKNP